MSAMFGVPVFVLLVVLFAVASLFSESSDFGADLIGDLRNFNVGKKLKCPTEKHVARYLNHAHHSTCYPVARRQDHVFAAGFLS